MRLPSPLVLALLAAAPASAQWSTATLSQARGSLSTATAGDLVLFAGGRVGGTMYDTVDVFDATTGAWSVTALSLARTGAAAASLGDLAFFGGGARSFGVTTDVVDVFDAQSGLWSVAHLSLARAGVGATAVGGRVLFAGGGVLGAVTDVVDIYDSALGAPDDPAAWSTATLSRPRSSVAAVTIGGLAVFAGGAGVQGVPFDDVDIYDSASGTWSTAQLSVARLVGATSAAAVGGRAYFVGGHFSQQGGPNMSDVVDVFDPQAGVWSTLTLPTARGYAGVTSLGSRLLVAGGVEQGFVGTAALEVFDTRHGQWAAPQQLSQAGAVVAAAVQGVALFAGGGSSTVDLYEPVGWGYCVAQPNSTGAAASLWASGSNRVALNGLTLHGAALPLHSLGYFLVSADRGLVVGPGGSQGDLCLGGAIGRLRGPGQVLDSGATGLVSLALDLSSLPTPTGPIAALAGDSWSFQLWFRDADPGPTSNFSDALEVELR